MNIETQQHINLLEAQIRDLQYKLDKLTERVELLESLNEEGISLCGE